VNEKPERDEARNDQLYRVEVAVCHGCLSGTPGECHSPGCFYWLHSIEEVPHDVLFAYVVDQEVTP
jgi:hypothetical protein